MINVVICDDHPMIRKGLRAFLSATDDICIQGEASSYAEAREVLRNVACDVLLLDLNLPGRDGMEVLASLVEAKSTTKVLIVSMYPESQYALRSLNAGAYGYLNKTGEASTYLQAIRTVAMGKKYVSPEVSDLLLEHLNQDQHSAPHDALSARELQVLLKIAIGHSLSQIAQELVLSPKTVSVYRSRVLEKLHLRNNVGLTTYAIQRHLI